MAVSLRERFEYATAQDPSLNYCLWEYPPPAPAEDKFRSVNLLYQSFEQVGMDARACDIVEAIRAAIGPFRTVFGVKLMQGRLAWELYFYDYRRRQREVSATRVLAAVRPFLPNALRPNEAIPYFMFSLDLSPALARGAEPLDTVHIYVGNPGSSVSSGIAYALRAEGTRLENFYFFFDAATQIADVMRKVSTSVYFDDLQCPVDAVVLPELRACKTICVANKSDHDCIYFSGIQLDKLIWFLESFKYPPDVVQFVRGHASRLDHLLFDVGFDYRFEGGRLVVLKSGYYGVF